MKPVQYTRKLWFCNICAQSPDVTFRKRLDYVEIRSIVYLRAILRGNHEKEFLNDELR